MNPAVLLTLAAMVPLACLGLLLGMSWLEDTLSRDVKRSMQRRQPEPVVAVPDRRTEARPLAQPATAERLAS